jgi:hypothetical protein
VRQGLALRVGDPPLDLTRAELRREREGQGEDKENGDKPGFFQ